MPVPRERFAERSGLYLVITRPAIPHVSLVAAAVERSVPVVQLREKHLTDRDLKALARSLREATRGSETLFIVNDRPDVAAEVGADGVHIGRSDMDAASARLIIGPEAVVGVSGNTPEEAALAASAGADYVGAGPVYPTTTKADARRPIGVAGIRAIADAVPEMPLVAIGGLSVGSAPDVLAAGADYAAVVSAICHARAPIEAMDELLAAISRRAG